jgi:hypothetical protein
MMTEWEDHGEEEQRLLLDYLDRIETQRSADASPDPPKLGYCWRLIGRLYLAYLRWRYRNHPR